MPDISPAHDSFDRPGRLRALGLALARLLRRARRELSGLLTSFAVHAGLLIALALLTIAAEPIREQLLLIEPGQGVGEDLEQLESEQQAPGGDALDAAHSGGVEVAVEDSLVASGPALLELAATPVSEAQPGGLVDGELLAGGQTAIGSGLEGRAAGNRGRLALARGGTPESEEAVERGLKWLAAHQMPDGSWKFNHDLACQGACRNPGTHACTTASTGVVLLAFLGAGHTHRAGRYQEVVQRGLYYLESRLLVTPQGGDMQEGTMYGQGLASMALCEAFAMTADQRLKPLAQKAIDFIVYAQDMNGGGWRYFPGQPGDVTVTGWQMMALKAAQLAYLQVPADTITGAKRFLDGMAAEGGAYYGYQTAEKRPTTTAIGLLCRMYTGWRHDNSNMDRGVAYLAKLGPAEEDMYFNYYATQVLHHFDGEPWAEWNPRMRDFLIRTQETNSHEAGSWFFKGGQLVTGGRLINTALAVMTLEVYYRYLPLYNRVVLDDEF